MNVGRLWPWTICSDAVARDATVLAAISRSPGRRPTRRQARHRLFQANPGHPGLHFKKLEGEEHIYSARIGLDYRAFAVINNDRVVWYWIGSHADYDRLV